VRVFEGPSAYTSLGPVDAAGEECGVLYERSEVTGEQLPNTLARLTTFFLCQVAEGLPVQFDRINLAVFPCEPPPPQAAPAPPHRDDSPGDVVAWQRDVFWHGMDAPPAIFRTPTLVASADGQTLLAFATKRLNDTAIGGSPMLMRRSGDGGASWEPPRRVLDVPADMGAPVHLGGGRLVMPFQCGGAGCGMGCALGQTASDDWGRTWAAATCLDGYVPQEFRLRGNLSPGPASAMLLPRSPPRLLFSFHATFSHAGVLYSDDGGATYTASRNASGGSGLAGASECALAPLANGRCAMRRAPRPHRD
jgi:sialidase-1